MNSEPGVHSDVCALPGCDNVIVQVEGRPRRRYCSAAHRAAARQLRSRGAAAQGTNPRPASVDPSTGTGDAASAAAATADTAIAEPGPAASGRQRVVFAVPRRLRQRRPAAEASHAERHSLNHRRRIGVVLTAALVTIGAGTWVGVTSVRVQQPPTLPPAGPPAADATQWASQAEVRLAALSEQLDRIAQTEAAWKSKRRSGPPPPAVERLAQVKTQLELQRTVLLGHMATWRSVPDVQAELDDLERQVASVEQTLAGLPTAGSGAGEPEGAVGDLTRQHEMWINQRDAKKAELERLRASVESVVETPLPAVPDLATPPVEAVRELLDPESPVPPDQPDPPPASPRGEDNRRPKDEVGIGAPPDPRDVRGGGPEGPEAPAGTSVPEAAVGGVLDAATSAVPTGDRGSAGTPPDGPPERSGTVGALAAGLPAEDASPSDRATLLAVDVADRYGYDELVSSGVEPVYVTAEQEAATQEAGRHAPAYRGSQQRAYGSPSGWSSDDDDSSGATDSSADRSSTGYSNAYSIASAYLAAYGS